MGFLDSIGDSKVRLEKRLKSGGLRLADHENVWKARILGGVQRIEKGR